MDFWLRNSLWRFGRWWEVTLTYNCFVFTLYCPAGFGSLHLLFPTLGMVCYLLRAVVTFPWYVFFALHQSSKQAPMVAFTCICKINNSVPTAKVSSVGTICWWYEKSHYGSAMGAVLFCLCIFLSLPPLEAQLVSGLQRDLVICWYLYNGPGTKHEK